MKEESRGSWRVAEEPLQNYPLLAGQFQGLQQQRELLAEARSHHFKNKKIPDQGNAYIIGFYHAVSKFMSSCRMFMNRGLGTGKKCEGKRGIIVS